MKLEQNSQLIDNFKNDMFQKTIEYQKIYGFEIGTGEHIRGIINKVLEIIFTYYLALVDIKHCVND